MKTKHIISCAMTFMLAVACLSAVGCAPSKPDPNAKGLTGGVAATVNGTEIEEDKITRYINSIRNSGDYESDDAWAKYLSDQKKTPVSMRDEYLGQLIDQELVKQYAEERGAVATDEQIDAAVQKMRDKYSSDDAWAKGLEGAGFDSEDDYREALQFSITYDNLVKSFEIENEDTKAEILTGLKDLNGAKKSSHILFAAEDKDKAEKVLDQIQNGTLDFAAAAREYSTDTGSAAEGGNVGWDKLTTFVDEYQKGLDGLGVDEIVMVESEYGHHIIKCTGVFTAPEKLDMETMNSIPREILTKAQESVESTDANDALKDWIDAKYSEAEVEINPIPENAPYVVDMSAYMTEEEQTKINDKAEKEMMHEVEETEEETTAEEATEEETAAEEATK